jgi:membrane protein required for colicin V production
MNYLDIIIIILILISAITGYKKGFIHQLASLAALVLGIFIAVKCSKWFAPYIQNHFTSSVNVAKIIAFIAIFILVIVAIHFLGKFLEKTFDEIELGFLNKIAGSLFSIVKMVFIVSVLMVLLKLSIIKIDWPKQSSMDESYTYKPVESVAPAIFPYLKMENDTLKNDNAKKR